MKLTSLKLAALSLLAAGAAFAQAMGRPAGSSPFAPYLPSDFSAALSFPYANRMERLGISADAGAVFGPNFLGFEATYFNPRETDYANGYQVNSREDVTTTLVLYRYRFPLSPMIDFPLDVYIGGGIGAGFTQLRSTLPAANATFEDRSRGNFAAEVQGGLAYSFNQRLGVRAGYRYFRIYDVELFGDKDNISDSAIEAALTFRF